MVITDLTDILKTIILELASLKHALIANQVVSKEEISGFSEIIASSDAMQEVEKSITLSRKKGEQQ